MGVFFPISQSPLTPVSISRTGSRVTLNKHGREGTREGEREMNNLLHIFHDFRSYCYLEMKYVALVSRIEPTIYRCGSPFPLPLSVCLSNTSIF